MEVKDVVTETKNIFKKLTNKAQSMFETLGEMVQRGVTVEEVSEMVKNNEDTKKTSKTLLGITYDFYKLKIQDLTFHLEVKKEVVDRILYFKVSTPEHTVFTYRSYEQGMTLKDKIKLDHLPEVVKQNT
ncbi:hypothetical protein DS745_15795 [Anaerobacillus alkaliphilus]|uniref:Uncharacterized protein n=1 Tax=Anaerobacillus alkaliphilus TaxID=1548597 RepID=A0A4Q0VNE0_9BACI|nr:hypothetical protein [Anaerobacillus alkaliphilus]RXI97823.1 hypothetical protein DS745_15795 [Anaerobacillus alkaliphilus]